MAFLKALDTKPGTIKLALPYKMFVNDTLPIVMVFQLAYKHAFFVTQYSCGFNLRQCSGRCSTSLARYGSDTRVIPSCKLDHRGTLYYML